MAKQKDGHIQFQGSVDNITYFKTKNGHIVRGKRTVDPNRIATDPRFARTRENNEEFAMAAKAASLFRYGLVDLMLGASDSRIVARVNKLMHDVKKMDQASVRGKRTISEALKFPGAKQKFVDFNFNELAPLKTILKRSMTVDTSTGAIYLENFNPTRHLNYPPGSSHVRFTCGVISLNFTTSKHEIRLSNEENVAIENVSSNLMIAPSELPPPGDVTLLLLRLECLQLMGNVYYPIQSEYGNPLAIVEVI